MKTRIAKCLKWLLSKVETPVDPSPLLEQARPLMGAQDAIDGRSGEAKRHQVLAQLMKQGATESDGALAIELVIQERKGRRWVTA